MAVNSAEEQAMFLGSQILKGLPCDGMCTTSILERGVALLFATQALNVCNGRSGSGARDHKDAKDFVL